MSRILCLCCRTIIQTKSRHDFQSCSCGRVSIDGGEEETRYLYESRTDFRILQADELVSITEPVPEQIVQSPTEKVNTKLFIAISGLIGAGKTTLAQALGDALSLPVHYEPVQENEYLDDFYRDMNKHAFPMQIYLLNKRFQQHQQIIWQGKGGVQDRTIYEDSVFARTLCKSGHVSERDLATYLETFSYMSNLMRKPDVIIHLDVTPERSLERIRQRARGCEVTVTLDYLQTLHAEYEQFLQDISVSIPVLRVDWNEFRPVDQVASMILREVKTLHNIKYV